MYHSPDKVRISIHGSKKLKYVKETKTDLLSESKCLKRLMLIVSLIGICMANLPYDAFNPD